MTHGRFFQLSSEFQSCEARNGRHGNWTRSSPSQRVSQETLPSSASVPSPAMLHPRVPAHHRAELYRILMSPISHCSMIPALALSPRIVTRATYCKVRSSRNISVPTAVGKAWKWNTADPALSRKRVAREIERWDTRYAIIYVHATYHTDQSENDRSTTRISGVSFPREKDKLWKAISYFRRASILPKPACDAISTLSPPHSWYICEKPEEYELRHRFITSSAQINSSLFASRPSRKPFLIGISTNSFVIFKCWYLCFPLHELAE